MDSGSTTTVDSKAIRKEKEEEITEKNDIEQSDDHRMSNEIHELARKYSTHRTNHEAPEMLFPVPPDTALDPASPQFNARAWARAYYASRSLAANGQMRTAGIAFSNMDVYGFGTASDYQSTVANVVMGAVDVWRKLTGKNQQRIDILRNLEGLVESGEMLCVLGPPGSGCSTTLKTIAGDTYGFHVDEQATLNYQGIRAEQIKKEYRGEAVYTAEVDNHFARLSVNDTLYFAARARCPKNIPDGIDRQEYAEHMRDVIMAIFGISHTKNTQVGNDFVRGVSGGERKRVTIAEAALGYAPLQCWDNSTRGLDSANAIEFCKTLRNQADILGCTSCVAIYQAPQAAYDIFDKVLVLYEGRQIFFGRSGDAKAYFENLGFECPEQQTTPDFLTSMTSESERIVRKGFEGRTPRTADEFAQAWKDSPTRAQLVKDIAAYNEAHPFDSHDHQKFLDSRRNDQSRMQRAKSPFNLSLYEQFKLNFWRSWTMLKGDPAITISMLVINFFQAIIIASIFYNLPANTSSFFRRTVLLFFVVLMNAFGSIIEIMTLYEKRKIVEKHARYAFYHPSMEAVSSIIVDMPYKVVNSLIMNITIYFMCNLRREPGPFFFFLLFSFLMTVTISMLFRFMGSATKSLEQALAPSAILLMALVLYSGFSIPPQYMQNWLGWLRWLNPVYYGLESVFLSEFVGRRFPCSEIVPFGPSYSNLDPTQYACSVAGAVPGEPDVSGRAYLETAFGFQNSHRWRNLGVMIAYMILFLGLHLYTTEYVASSRSKGEVLVFTREAMKKQRKLKAADDVEKGDVDGRQSSGKDSDSDGNVDGMEAQKAIFHWRDVCYDIKIKSEDRRILDNVDGWVKPGTLTALMVRSPLLRSTSAGR
jgi:ATP-binding cassette, subfamily G (WHITE), member 2, PDR